MKRIVLLDTHALIHRAYHALPDFRASDGTPTGALYGLSNMIASIIRDLKPDYIFACYDLPGKTFRHEAYTEYKGTRKAGDDDLITQLISSREIINALNIPIIDAVGYEADDVIGTLAKKFSDKNKYDIIIASGDMDTMQLIEDKHVRVFTLKKGITETVLIDEDAVIERFGFPPKYIADYKGLRGDASDNIPGVPGIGEKTASILISNFQTIENLYKVLNKNSDDVKSVGVTDRIIGILKDNEEGAIFSKC
jgi:DNA polymerase-1